MPLSNRENYLSNASMQGHEWIPSVVGISKASWYEHREAMEEVCLKHPLFFPNFEKGKIDFDEGGATDERKTWVDEWGCKWEAEISGLEGVVTGHPLDDWSKFDSWSPPEQWPFTEESRKLLADRRARGQMVNADFGKHGFFFMRLYYLRGFDNFMMDVATEEPLLDKLVEAVAGYHEKNVQPYVDAGIDVLYAADDLGTQTASMLGPKHFRRWVLPTYKRLFQPARKTGAHVFLHADGYLMDIADQIIDSGVSILNPQDIVNGIDAMAEQLKGRICISCDVDRQKTLPFGSPGDVRDLIREEVMKLGSPGGGLELSAGIYPPTGPANVDAACSAIEEFRTYWVGK